MCHIDPFFLVHYPPSSRFLLFVTSSHCQMRCRRDSLTLQSPPFPSLLLHSPPSHSTVLYPSLPLSSNYPSIISIFVLIIIRPSLRSVRFTFRQYQITRSTFSLPLLFPSPLSLISPSLGNTDTVVEGIDRSSSRSYSIPPLQYATGRSRALAATCCGSPAHCILR